MGIKQWVREDMRIDKQDAPAKHPIDIKEDDKQTDENKLEENNDE